MSEAPTDWPFDQPRNLAVFTVRQVMEGSLPILLVCHDRDDGGWQFLTNHPLDMMDARLVSLEEIVRLDASTVQLADLPEGYEAIRATVASPWRRREK